MKKTRVQFFSASLQGGYCWILASPGTVGFLMGKSVGHNGSFSVTLFRDLPVPAFLFLFHSTLPRDFTMNFHSLPNPWGVPNCGGWEESRRKLVLCFNSCHHFTNFWVSRFFRCGVSMLKTRNTKRETLFSTYEYRVLFTIFLSKGNMTCRSFNFRFEARVKILKGSVLASPLANVVGAGVRNLSSENPRVLGGNPF